ncbi:hypothetical protein ES703_96237 [subsurface metagenome]
MPCISINRVDATFRESLKRVVTRSREGNMEKSRGFSVYMAIRRIVIARVIFRARRKSRSIVGKGMIITTRIVTTPTTVSISLTVAGVDFDLKASSIL